MKLLIIDDDMAIVEYLAECISWKELGITRVGRAYNAREAQLLAEQECWEIILCDIEMPQMDGIEFLRWLRDHKSESEFIFLTCHEEFQYAREAIKYQAAGYLTKPADVQSVRLTVLRAAERIREKNEREQYHDYGKMWIKDRNRLVAKFWDDYLNGQQDWRREQLLKKMAELEIMSGENAFIMVLTGVNITQIEETSWRDASFYFAFGQLAAEMLTGEVQYENSIGYRRGTFYYCLILLPAQLYSEQRLFERGREAIRRIAQFLNCPAACIISTAGSVEDLPAKKLRMETCLPLKKEGQVYRESDIPDKERDTEVRLDSTRLTSYLEQGDRMAVMQELKRVLLTSSREHLLNEQYIYELHQAFLQILYTWLNEQEIVATMLYREETAQLLFQQAENSMFDFLKWVEYVVDTAVCHVEELRKKEPIVRKVQEYIWEHYQENIRRDELAQLVYLTPNYVSKLFNEKAGMSISEYVNQYRIKIAKKMLSSEGQTISEIASGCGFDSISYFTTLFKKTEGISPGEYRKRVRG